jgi:hypothetical protein
MMKFNLELTGWNWCGCMKGNTLETGAYLDISISIKVNILIKGHFFKGKNFVPNC